MRPSVLVSLLSCGRASPLSVLVEAQRPAKGQRRKEKGKGQASNRGGGHPQTTTTFFSGQLHSLCHLLYLAILSVISWPESERERERGCCEETTGGVGSGGPRRVHYVTEVPATRSLSSLSFSLSLLVSLGRGRERERRRERVAEARERERDLSRPRRVLSRRFSSLSLSREDAARTRETKRDPSTLSRALPPLATCGPRALGTEREREREKERERERGREKERGRGRERGRERRRGGRGGGERERE